MFITGRGCRQGSGSSVDIFGPLLQIRVGHIVLYTALLVRFELPALLLMELLSQRRGLAERFFCGWWIYN